MKEISVKQLLMIQRPTLGDHIPISFWRLIRLIAMPRALGDKTTEINRNIGLEMGKLLNVKKPEDIIDAINNSQIGLCNPLEKKAGFYAIEFKECLTCSGIKPTLGRAICDFEVAIIEGAMNKLKVKITEIKETKCIGGLGDNVCRIEIKTKKK